MNLKQSLSDPCVYISSGLEFLVAVYVDDIILGGNNGIRIKEVKKELSKKFEMKDLGKLHHFLGVAVNQDQKTGSIWIGQASYIRKLLQKFEMSDCKPVKSPANPGVKLTSSGDGDYVCDEKIFRVLIGSLLFLSTRTRPDIAYAVGCAARFCSNPTREHWTAAKRILRYLKGTVNLGLLYSPTGSPDFVGYCDADWAGDMQDRKSTSGYLFMQGSAAITWRSCKQSCVSLSTTEAEYVALAEAAQEAVWLQKLNSDLLGSNVSNTLIYEDKKSDKPTKNQAH